MFERLTEPCQVVVLAQEEARALKHNYIGTEHILLGLLRVEEGLAARVLESLEITVERVREWVVRIAGSDEEVTSRQMPLTPRAKKVLGLALREALSLRHDYIGTEHVLLGLVRENEGVSRHILLDFGADAAKIRNQVLGMLPASGPEAASRVPSWPIDPAWLDGFGPVLNQLADEIRTELHREPDAGDVLLVLGTATGSLPARALAQLSIDNDQLSGQIEQLRMQGHQARQRLAEQLDQARTAKELAIEADELQTAALHRDQERIVVERILAERRLAAQATQMPVSAEGLAAIRRRLGLPSPPDPTSATAD